jgi:large subunit ribosomal protein L5
MIKEKYKEIKPILQKEFGYKNTMSVPRIEKVVINIGFGRQTTGKTPSEQADFYKPVIDDLSLIAGQRLTVVKARHSISEFKLRQGTAIGARVTLRSGRMYDFLDRLINVSLPRSRDFQGIEGFDKEGNLNIGIKEHIIFPEVSPERSKNIFSFQITVVTTAKTKEEGRRLVELLGFPLKKNA